MGFFEWLVIVVSVIVGFSTVVFKYFELKNREGALKCLDFAINVIVRFFYLSVIFSLMFFLTLVVLDSQIVGTNFMLSIYFEVMLFISIFMSVSLLFAACGGGLAYLYFDISFFLRKLLKG